MNITLDLDPKLEQEDLSQVPDGAYKAASTVHEEESNTALGLKLISLRLQETLVNDLKVVARANGLGYQPLIRQVLTKYVAEEMHKLAIERATELAAKR